MKHFLHTILLAYIVFIPSHAIAVDYETSNKSLYAAQNEMPEVNSNTVVIVKGTISNYDSIQKHIDSNSYLQIIQVSEDGKVNLTVEDGSLVFQSNSTKTEFPKESAFAIKIEQFNTQMKYFIAAQRLNWPTNQAVMLSTKDGKWLSIDYSKVTDMKDKGENILNIGNVFIPLK